ncbi:MAG: hypothetical protein VB125_02210 [Burkholderia sp.]
MPFWLNALLLHFDLETALRPYVRFMQQRPGAGESGTVVITKVKEKTGQVSVQYEPA